MRVANDMHGFRVYITRAEKDGKYFCPFCNDEMIVRKGRIMAWHFAHKHARCGKAADLEKKEKIAESITDFKVKSNHKGFRKLLNITEIWKKFDPDVMIVKNTLSGRLFRIHEDHEYTANKYHNHVYGYVSDKDGTFQKGSESLDIYSWDKPIWELVWYRRG